MKEAGMIPKETVDAMAEIILQGDMDVCICRRSPFDKHDINPPCPKRQWALGKARRVLEAAAPYLRAQALEDAAAAIEALRPEMGPGINITQYREGRNDAFVRAADLCTARAVAERGE